MRLLLSRCDHVNFGNFPRFNTTSFAYKFLYQYPKTSAKETKILSTSWIDQEATLLK